VSRNPAVAWSSKPYSPAAAGESGPWGAHLGRAWGAAADPAGEHPAPPTPVLMDDPEADLGSHHAELLAYWGPMLHLLVFGLGWTRPDLGLQRWHEMGQPTEHPILAVASRWWGPFIPDVLAWAGNSDRLASAGVHLTPGGMQLAPGGAHLGPGSGRSPSSAKVDDRWLEVRRSDPHWQRLWSGGDPMHLADHVGPPAEENSGAPGRLLVGSHEDGRAAVLCDEYRGWHHALSHCGLTQTRHGRSWRVDVIVRPLGWLGTYRLSRETGVWFSGRHRWHRLGW
jgi:hypothetical protein